MRLSTVILAIVVYGYQSYAVPQILFPINSQVPPVARASLAFSFTFAPSTFSTDLTNTYTLSNAPEWLSLDSETRTLSGTSTPGDANLNISITASDDTGSVTMNSELVVRMAQGPVVQIPLDTQPASFGNGTFSSPSTVLYYPSSHFDIQFSPQTFSESGTSSTLSYYAVTQDNTPLPSWVLFDADSLSFSGQTPDYPSLAQPRETFDILLIASDVEGFAGVSIPFNIVVGNHILAFKDANSKLQGEAGTAFQYEGLSDSLELDGQAISATNLSSITAQVPSWLDFDNSTFILSGTPPENASSCNVTVSAVDFYGDNASTLIAIDLSTTLFNQNVTQLNATIGKAFSYDFTSSLVEPSSVEVTAQFEPATPWLSFDPKTITLSGQVPNEITPSTVKITLQASSKTSSDSQSMPVVLNVISGALQSSAAKTSSAPSSTSKHVAATTTDPASVISDDSDGKKLYRKKITKAEIAAIVVPLVLLVFAVSSCIFWCCSYRQQPRRRERAKSPNKSDISGPVPVTQLHSPVESLQTLPKSRPRKNQIIANNHAIFNEMTQKSRRTSTLRKSQTMSNLSGARSSCITDSNSSGNRGRSLSENALSTDQSNWTTTATVSSGRSSGGRKMTQTSAYPTIHTSRPNSGRATRNFSRKKDSSGQLLREDSSNIQVYSRPSTTSRNSIIQQTPENNYDTTMYLPKEPGFSHHPGTLVHEVLDGFLSDQPVNHSARSRLSRSRPSWFRDLNPRSRESVFSVQTQDTNVLFSSVRSSKSKNQMSNCIRMVTPSPQAPPKAHLSTIEASPRTVYKPSRSNGGAGFFLGGSRSSSRTYRSSSLRSGYVYSNSMGYSNNDSPALPDTFPANLSPANHANSNFNSPAMGQMQQCKGLNFKAQQSTLEKMVSAAGFRSNDDDLIPDFNQNLVGLGTGHGKPIEGSNDGSLLSHRLSILSNISNRFSRTFQFRNSRQSYREGDTESQFQEAEEGDGMPGRYRKDDRVLHVGESDKDSGASEEEYYDEEPSPEHSIISEYSRQNHPIDPSSSQNYHVHDETREDNAKTTRNSFELRYSRGIPIEYYADEESPTLGQGTLGEIQKIVVNGRRNDGGLAEERGIYNGGRIPDSPVVVELRGKVDKSRKKIGGGRWDEREGESFIVGLGVGLRLPERGGEEEEEEEEEGEQARIVRGREKRPVSVNVGDGYEVKRYEYKGGGVLRRGSASASRYGFDDDLEAYGDRNRETFEDGSAFL